MSSVCPLPSTPAIPTISPALTSNEAPRTASSPRSSRTRSSSTSRSGSPGCRGLLDPQHDLAADHERARPSGVAPSRGTVSICLALAEDGDPVRDLEHLVQLVADEDDRLPVGLERADDREELARLLRREDGRRLVEDQDLGAAVERLQDLGALLHPDADRRDARFGPHREAELRRELADALLGAPRGRGTGPSSAPWRGRCSRPPS